MITEEIKKKIRDIVGFENVLDSDLDRFGYSYDSSFVPLLPANKPDLVVRPLTTEEVAKLMAVAYEHVIPVTPRGAASGIKAATGPLAIQLATRAPGSSPNPASQPASRPSVSSSSAKV